MIENGSVTASGVSSSFGSIREAGMSRRDPSVEGDALLFHGANCFRVLLYDLLCDDGSPSDERQRRWSRETEIDRNRAKNLCRNR